MYRRYIIIGFVLFLLIGAYFVFFDNNKDDKEYLKYYDKLVDRENYQNSINGVDVTIEEVEHNGGYSYMITFENADDIKNNVKILVANGNSKKETKEYFPTFGIVDNKGCSIVPNSTQLDDEQINVGKGVNLSFFDDEKIEYLLIYISFNSDEQFARVKVSNY